MSFARVIGLLRAESDDFRRYLVDLLRDSPFACFRFEAPPVSTDALGRAFELVLVDSPEIDSPADPRDFQPQFDRRSGEVLVFDNLGGDATLVAPRPPPSGPGYAHLAGFTRQAPLARQLTLWRVVGDTLDRLVGDTPLWLNTAGGGVPWLHVRLDTTPKYYVFQPYHEAP